MHQAWVKISTVVMFLALSNNKHKLKVNKYYKIVLELLVALQLF